MAIDGDYRAGPHVAQERGAAMQRAASDLPAEAAPTSDSGRALRLLGLVAVAVGLAALTAAACALSYSSIHQLAIEAGVTRQLARIYPLIFDALLVIAGCSVLALRGAGLPSRIYAWFCLLVLLGALAGGGAVHAAAVHIPRKLAAIVAAVIPWPLVLIGFGLLLALLRYARTRRLGRLRYGADVAGDDQMPDEAVRMGAAESSAHQALPASTGAGMHRTPGAAALPVGPGARGTPEPATRPLPAAPAPYQGQAGEQPAAGQQAPGQTAPGQTAPGQTRPGQMAPGQTAPEQTAPGQMAPRQTAPGQRPKPAVRQAELQLRARIPRQPAEQPATDAAGSPFVPSAGPVPGREQTNPRAAENPAAVAPTVPGAKEDAEGGAADEPGQPDALNPAPVQDETGEPPELRRPHSSPTPPGD